jgi:hypothetical protein
MSTCPSHRRNRKTLWPLDPPSSEHCASSFNPWLAGPLRPDQTRPPLQLRPGRQVPTWSIATCDDWKPMRNGWPRLDVERPGLHAKRKTVEHPIAPAAKRRHKKARHLRVCVRTRSGAIRWNETLGESSPGGATANSPALQRWGKVGRSIKSRRDDRRSHAHSSVLGKLRWNKPESRKGRHRVPQPPEGRPSSRTQFPISGSPVLSYNIWCLCLDRHNRQEYLKHPRALLTRSLFKEATTRKKRATLGLR